MSPVWGAAAPVTTSCSRSRPAASPRRSAPVRSASPGSATAASRTRCRSTASRPELERALDRAAALLGEARGSLLVVLGAELTVSAYGAALALADALGAVTDGVVSEPAAAGILAGQRRGRATATLGEIRNRADLIVYWAVDPDQRYPRYRSRYAGAPRALHLAEGAHPRTIVSVSVGSDAGTGRGRPQGRADTGPGARRAGRASGRTAGPASRRRGAAVRRGRAGGPAHPGEVRRDRPRRGAARGAAHARAGGGADRADPGAQRADPGGAQYAAGRRQPERRRSGEHVADRLPLRGGFLPRGAPVPAAPASRQSRGRRCPRPCW